jgi:hypothetical protein
MERAYHPLAYKTNARAELVSCGFVDVQEQIIRIPLNPWPKDPEEKNIGRWFNVAFGYGLEAMSLAPLTRMYNWQHTAVAELYKRVKREIDSKQLVVKPFSDVSICKSASILGLNQSAIIYLP